MSTSRQSFDQAVSLSKMEEGIRRIEAKLDVIISQNAEQIKHLIAIESNTKTIIKQNNAIFAATVASAYFSAVSAAHAKSLDAKIEAAKLL